MVGTVRSQDSRRELKDERLKERAKEGEVDSTHQDHHTPL